MSQNRIEMVRGSRVKLLPQKVYYFLFSLRCPRPADPNLIEFKRQFEYKQLSSIQYSHFLIYWTKESL